MSKACYSDYVAHCLRFYCRGHVPEGLKPIDRANWDAVYAAMNSLELADRDIIRMVYSSGENTNDSIRAVSASTGVDVDRLWTLVKRTERRVAEERGLA